MMQLLQVVEDQEKKEEEAKEQAKRNALISKGQVRLCNNWNVPACKQLSPTS